MGLSIHYSGRFNPACSLQEMIKEVADIAAIYEWPYEVHEDQFPKKISEDACDNKIYGIDITPPASETLSLCFLSNGRMSSAVNLRFFGNTHDIENEKMLYMLFTKTQYAGIYVHIFIIKLLRYISKKYFIDFELSDEGQYWETGDKKLLAEMFARYNSLLDQVGGALQSFPMGPGETFEIYFERLLKQIKRE